MIDGKKNARENGDGGKEVKARRKLIAKKQISANGRDDRLNV